MAKKLYTKGFVVAIKKSVDLINLSDCLGKQEDRKDLSHPVHADNCILDEAMGECNKVAPAYTWRDYRYRS